jgi:hypothetical protein
VQTENHNRRGAIHGYSIFAKRRSSWGLRASKSAVRLPFVEIAAVTLNTNQLLFAAGEWHKCYAQQQSNSRQLKSKMDSASPASLEYL